MSPSTLTPLSKSTDCAGGEEGNLACLGHFLAIRGVYLRLDTHESIRVTKERTNKLREDEVGSA